MSNVTRVAVLLVCVSLLARIARTQQTSSGPTGHGFANPAGGSTIRAAPIEAVVTLDGRLDEPVWATADSIDDFRQLDAVEGAPASERTVVKVVRLRCQGPNALPGLPGRRPRHLHQRREPSAHPSVSRATDAPG